MSAAQLSQPQDVTPEAASPMPPFELTPAEVRDPADLRQQVAERLAAHRARREKSSPAPAPSAAPQQRPVRGRSSEIAAAVAERYAHSQSYRAFLAAEAERAVHQAEAAAQVASINAQAIAVAQQQLLADLDNWGDVPEMPRGPVALPEAPLAPTSYGETLDRDVSHSIADTFGDRDQAFAPAAEALDRPRAPLTVRHYEQNLPTAPPPIFHHEPRPLHAAIVDEEESLALDDEIAFRHNPVFEDPGQPEDIAANLIEFPRQLVAPRKARPRLAEGPLRDEADAASRLRIFEVEAGHHSPSPAPDAHSPNWSSILLSAQPAPEFLPEEALGSALLPQVAPLNLRIMAAVVDACIIFAVQLVFTAVFVVALTHLSGREAVLEIPRLLAAGASLGTLGVLATLYQLLFFTLSDSTPGMRYARVGLCTFSDENPTRSAMRLRIFATLVSAAPLGLGLVWALLDEDTLGWHDRISRMYQRAY